MSGNITTGRLHAPNAAEGLRARGSVLSWLGLYRVGSIITIDGRQYIKVGNRPGKCWRDLETKADATLKNLASLYLERGGELPHWIAENQRAVLSNQGSHSPFLVAIALNKGEPQMSHLSFEFRHRTVTLAMLKPYPAAVYEIAINGAHVGYAERDSDGGYTARSRDGLLVKQATSRKYAVTALLIEMEVAQSYPHTPREEVPVGMRKRMTPRFCQCASMLAYPFDTRCGSHGRHFENGQFWCGRHRPSKMVLAIQGNHEATLDTLRDSIHDGGIVQETRAKRFEITGAGIEVALPTAAL